MIRTLIFKTFTKHVKAKQNGLNCMRMKRDFFGKSGMKTLLLQYESAEMKSSLESSCVLPSLLSRFIKNCRNYRFLKRLVPQYCIGFIAMLVNLQIKLMVYSDE